MQQLELALFICISLYVYCMLISCLYLLQFYKIPVNFREETRHLLEFLGVLKLQGIQSLIVKRRQRSIEGTQELHLEGATESREFET